jgi:hypothetical protein
VPYVQESFSGIVMSKFQKGAVDECWPWLGITSRGGYGRVNKTIGPYKQTMLQAHRVVYELLVGPIPPDMTLDHDCHTRTLECPGGPTCSHRRCVNPAHLVPMDAKLNTSLGKRRQTHCKYEHPLSGDNCYTAPTGRRRCRACLLRRSREFEARHPERKDRPWSTTRKPVSTC